MAPDSSFVYIGFSWKHKVDFHQMIIFKSTIQKCLSFIRLWILPYVFKASIWTQFLKGQKIFSVYLVLEKILGMRLKTEKWTHNKKRTLILVGLKSSHHKKKTFYNHVLWRILTRHRGDHFKMHLIELIVLHTWNQYSVWQLYLNL